MEMIKKLIDESDLVIEVVDARFVSRSRIKEIEDYTKKPLLIVVNKTDLVNESCINEIKKQLTGMNYCLVSVKNRKGIGLLRKKIKKILKGNGKKKKCCVVGLPNTGKSSLINLLRGRHVTRTSIKPGFTKGHQYVRLSKNILLIDTPGIFIPQISQEDLAFLNAIDLDKIENIEIAALSVAEKLKNKVESVYGINIDENFFINLAKKFNYLLKKGQPDLNRAYRKFLQDWYEGKIKACFLD